MNALTLTQTPAEPIIPLCTHIKTNGRPCRSPALNGEALCYFHNRIRVTHQRPQSAEPLLSYYQEDSILQEGGGSEEDPLAVARAYPRQNQIEFPPLEDAESVQLATSILFQAIATGQIHFKRARLLLYTLKIAAINQRALTQSRAADAADPAPPKSVISPSAPHPESTRSSQDAGKHLFAKVTDLPASEEVVSEIGRDFSPGITGAESFRALAPGTSLPHANPHPFHILPTTPTNSVSYA